jgi:hypothetical protein
MTEPAVHFRVMLQALTDHSVDFIVVGGVGAVLHGAPLATFDLDIVHSRAPENLDRLLAALDTLDVYYRHQGERRLKPKLSHLAAPGHQLLMTRAGPLDVLGMVGKLGKEVGYDELIAHTREVMLTGGLKVRVLDLEILIQLKEEAGRDKDMAALPVLRQTLEEQRKAERKGSSQETAGPNAPPPETP